MRNKAHNVSSGTMLSPTFWNNVKERVFKGDYLPERFKLLVPSYTNKDRVTYPFYVTNSKSAH
jgi:hypothetical protein